MQRCQRNYSYVAFYVPSPSHENRLSRKHGLPYFAYRRHMDILSRELVHSARFALATGHNGLLADCDLKQPATLSIRGISSASISPCPT